MDISGDEGESLASITSREWADIARNLIEQELLRKNMSYQNLAENLHQQGMPLICPRALRAKITQGDFSAAFLIRLFRCMGSDAIDFSLLEHLFEDHG